LKHSRNRILGPGTRATLFGVAAFAIYGYVSQPQAIEPRGGGMVSASQPLWKPEPALLLNSLTLKLSASQKAGVSRISKQWEARRAELLGQIQPMANQLQARGRATVRTIQSDAAAYSEISRLYDVERRRAWNSAIAKLDSTQRALVESNRGELR